MSAFAIRSSPARDRVRGDITTLFFRKSLRISNGLNNAQGALFASVVTIFLLQSINGFQRPGKDIPILGIHLGFYRNGT